VYGAVLVFLDAHDYSFLLLLLLLLLVVADVVVVPVLLLLDVDAADDL